MTCRFAGSILADCGGLFTFICRFLGCRVTVITQLIVFVHERVLSYCILMPYRSFISLGDGRSLMPNFNLWEEGM